MGFMEQIKNLVDSLEILKKAIVEHNQEKSLEAVTICLFRFTAAFGHDEKVSRDTFSTLEELKHHIMAGDYTTACARVLSLLAMFRSIMSRLSSLNPGALDQ
jgi:hypothetical protein